MTAAPPRPHPARLLPMRIQHALLTVLLLAVGAFSGEAGVPPASPAPRIIALTQALMDSIVSGDGRVWDRILHQDATVVDEFGRRQTKTEAVQALKPLPAGFSGSIEVRHPRVHVQGATAMIEFEAYEQEQVFDQQLVVRYHFMATYLRAGRDWKLFAMQNLTLPDDPPALPVRDLRLDDYPGTYRYGPGRAFTIRRKDDHLCFTARAGGPEWPLNPVATDVFFDMGEEKNLLIFQRDASGRVFRLIQRRKFNDLTMTRLEPGQSP
ncbi:MAG TPA: DUF4440 domain-containing protein [Geothrix sp.]|nr:DUF4440 domain-containing protein [Geothrix sp.]